MYSPDVEFEIIANVVQHFIQCHPDVMTKVAIHLIFPSEKPPKRLSKKFLVNCSTSSETLIQTFTNSTTAFNNPAYQEWRKTFPYPQNVVRNVARKGID
jgi:hypothetical protein